MWLIQNSTIIFFFILINFKTFLMKFHDFSMILKQTWISMIFQELWEPSCITKNCNKGVFYWASKSAISGEKGWVFLSQILEKGVFFKLGFEHGIRFGREWRGRVHSQTSCFHLMTSSYLACVRVCFKASPWLSQCYKCQIMQNNNRLSRTFAMFKIWLTRIWRTNNARYLPLYSYTCLKILGNIY